MVSLLFVLYGGGVGQLSATSWGALLGTSFWCLHSPCFLSLVTASAVCFCSGRGGGASPVTLPLQGSPCRGFPSFLRTVQGFLATVFSRVPYTFGEAQEAALLCFLCLFVLLILVFWSLSSSSLTGSGGLHLFAWVSAQVSVRQRACHWA